MTDNNGFEDVMRNEPSINPTEAPKRVRSGGKSRIAKLTKRTIESLRATIREGKLERAYDKYNKKYAKMRSKLIIANEVRENYEDPSKKTSKSEVWTAYDRVASYDRKLAKWGAKLVKYDIKELARVHAESKAKPLKLPRIMYKLLPPIARLLDRGYDKVNTKVTELKLRKEIKDETKVNIKKALDGALFKNQKTGELTSTPNEKVIKEDLKLNQKGETFEERVANLKKFITLDGEKLVEEPIGPKVVNGPDVPPVEPEGTVEKKPSNLTFDDILAGIKKPEVSEKSTPEVTKVEEKTEPTVAKEEVKPLVISDITKGIENKETKEVPEVKPETNRDKEYLGSLNANLEALRAQAEKVDDPEVKKVINTYVDAINKEIAKIVNDTKKEETTKTVENVVESAKVEVKPTTTEEKVVNKPVEETKVEVTFEPAKVEVKPQTETKVVEEPKVDATETKAVVPYNFTNAPTGRVAQSSEPKPLVVTPQMLEDLKKRNEAAKQRIETVRPEIEELKAQKAKLEEYIQNAKITRENEITASKLEAERAELVGAVAELNNEATAINNELGSSRYMK